MPYLCHAAMARMVCCARHRLSPWAQLSLSYTQCLFKINNWIDELSEKSLWAKLFEWISHRWMVCICIEQPSHLWAIFPIYTRTYILINAISFYFLPYWTLRECVRTSSAFFHFVRLVGSFSVCYAFSCSLLLFFYYYYYFVRSSFILHLSTLECQMWMCIWIYVCDCHCCCCAVLCHCLSFSVSFLLHRRRYRLHSSLFGFLAVLAGWAKRECVVRSTIFMYGNWFGLNGYQRCIAIVVVCIHKRAHHPCCRIGVLNGYRCIIFLSYLYKSYSTTDLNRCALVCDQHFTTDTALLLYPPFAHTLSHSMFH